MLIFGCGYSATAIATRLLKDDWYVAGTRRTLDGASQLHDVGIDGLVFDGEATSEVGAALSAVSHVLISAAPGEFGDPILQAYPRDSFPDHVQWIGYLSTIGVYGDSGGAWIDETAPRNATGNRNRRRIKAEDEWFEFGDKRSVQIFRLAGIYGPGRGPFAKLKTGSARAIIKSGQVFNRIHVNDIAEVVVKSIERPAEVGAPVAYNVADDEPASPEIVLDHAANLLGVPPPPRVDFETSELSPMARSFYADCKRVRNNRIKEKLGVSLSNPTYREGLASIKAYSDKSL